MTIGRRLSTEEKKEIFSHLVATQDEVEQGKDLARRFCLGGAAFFTVMLAAVPLIGNTVNGATGGLGQTASRVTSTPSLAAMGSE